MNSENGKVAGFALLWILIKLGFLGMGQAETGFHAGVLLNMLFLVLLPFLALRSYYRSISASEGFLVDLKVAARPAAKYALLAGLLIFAYYKWLDPDFSAEKIEAAMSQLESQIPNETAYAAIAAEDPTLRSVSYADYMKKNKDGIEMIYSPGMQAGASFVALVFAGLFYSLLITLFYRKLLLKI